MSMTEFDQDKDLQVLHDRYQMESDEMPSTELDNKILQAAHQAVNKKRNQSKSQWFVPLSYAAVLVLSLSVVMKLALDTETEVLPLQYSEFDQVDEEVQSSTDLPDTVETQKSSQDKQLISTVAKKRKTMAKKEVQRSKIKIKQAEEPVMLQRSAPIASYGQHSPVPASVMSEMKVKNDFTEQQQIKIKKMRFLLHEKRYMELKAELLSYRRHYPAGASEPRLPDELILWESKNIK